MERDFKCLLSKPGWGNCSLLLPEELGSRRKVVSRGRTKKESLGYLGAARGPAGQDHSWQEGWQGESENRVGEGLPEGLCARLGGERGMAEPLKGFRMKYWGLHAVGETGWRFGGQA